MSRTNPLKDDAIKLAGLFPWLVILVLLLTACGGAPATEAPAATSEALGLDEQMAQIDSALKQTLRASIAYNKPESMTLDQTVTIELLLNPSLSPQALSTQVTETGQVASTSIQITPRMKALLVANDSTAFVIQPIHDSPEQLVSSVDTTRWQWLVTAKEGGTQRLTLVIYRLVKYEGQEYWREVETYRADIDVKVTFIQHMQAFDWQWIVGIVITLIGVPALWRYIDNKNKKRKSPSR